MISLEQLGIRSTRSTLQGKLAIGITTLIGLISLFIFLFFPARLERQAERASLDKATSIAETMAYAVSPALVFADLPTLDEYLGEAGQIEDLMYVVVLDASGDVVGALNRERAERFGLTGDESPISEREMLLRATSPVIHQGAVIGHLHLGLSLSALRQEVRASRASIALVSLVIFVLGLLGAISLAARLTRPLSQIARTFDEIASGDLSKRAAVAARDEIGDLAKSFNLMVDQLQTAHDSLRNINVDLEQRVAARTGELQLEVEVRRRAEEAFRASEERFRAMFRSAGMGIVLLDRDWRVHKSNPAMRRLLGYGEGELQGHNLSEFLHEDDRPAVCSLFTELIDGKRDHFDVETSYVRKDGLLRWCQLTISSIPSGNGKPHLAIGMVEDITRRKRLERELLDAQQRALSHEQDERERAERLAEKLSHIPRLNPHPVVELLPDGRITYLNEVAEELVKSAQADEAGAILPADVVAIVRESLASGRTYSGFEVRVGRRTLTWSFYPLTTDGVVYGYGFDITDRLELEKQLREAQKLEAVGRLAGGVAHDFNNVLMAITGLSGIVLDELDPGDRLRDDVEQIQKAADRAASLTRQLLAFSRKQILKPVKLNLNAAISDMEKMLRRLIGEDVELVTVLERDVWSVEADRGQIEQVLMNLAVNARDAMPEGGRVTIATRNVELDDNAARDLDCRAGSYCMLVVSDTGTGMTEKTRSRLFEPFFTTKELGKGTGLGLSTVYGIVKQSDGFITVESKLGEGTTFKILLPKVDARAEELELESLASAPLRGCETILLVEDEAMVRELASRVLRKNGYSVLQAANGAEALELSERFDKKIDLVVTDVVMPRMSGRELMERLAVLRPETKVIYMTGYTDDAILHYGVLDSGIELIQKPFKPAVLLNKVRDVLNGEVALAG